MQRRNRIIPERFTLFLLLYCVASFTVFQFIPLYFTSPWLRLAYYASIYLVLAFCSVVELRGYLKRTVQYLFTKVMLGIVLFLGLMIGLLFVIGKSMSTWTEAATYYVNENNPDVKIISRYINLGAYGGGTEPADYEVVLHRPVTPLFSLETPVDTAKIDKAIWIKFKH